jgi:protein involved in polysaccharide export with SLBB domain
MRRETPMVMAVAAILCAAGPLDAQSGREVDLPSASRQPMAQPPLAPGDMIRIRFWQEPELSGEFPVDERGLVTLPLLGMREATHEPADRVKTEIITEYARQLRDQPAQVTILRRIGVVGAVRDPGLYHVDPTMSLSDAIALAGGLEPDAKQDRIQLVRDGRRLHAALDGSAVVPNLRSGDQIVVPRRSWVSRNVAVVIGAALSALAILVRG